MRGNNCWMPGSCLAIRSIRHGSIMQPPTTCDRHLAIARESDWFRAKPTLIRPSSDSIHDEIRASANSPGSPMPRSPRSGGRWRYSNSTGHAGPRRSSVSITGIRPDGPSGGLVRRSNWGLASPLSFGWSWKCLGRFLVRGRKSLCDTLGRESGKKRSVADSDPGLDLVGQQLWGQEPSEAASADPSGKPCTTVTCCAVAYLEWSYSK